MPEIEVGKVTHYFGHAKAAVVLLSDALRVGDRIHIKGSTTDFEQEVRSMEIEHGKLQEAKAGQEVGLEVNERVREHDIVYKVV